MTVVVKQYGEKRTGTNLLRSYLTRYWREVLVLIHALGDKHSPPVDLAEVWARTEGAPDQLLAFVEAATMARPAETTLAGDSCQAAFLRNWGGTIGRAYQEHELRFAISVKHPYSWVVSAGRFESWAGFGREEVRVACGRFNENYRAWFRLRDSYPGKVLVVPYERLLGDLPATMDDLAFALGLPNPGTVSSPPDVVVPTYWDDSSTRSAVGFGFDNSFYKERRFFQLLDPVSLGVIRNEIDWSQLREAGYTTDSGY